MGRLVKREESEGIISAPPCFAQRVVLHACMERFPINRDLLFPRESLAVLTVSCCAAGRLIASMLLSSSDSLGRGSTLKSWRTEEREGRNKCRRLASWIGRLPSNPYPASNRYQSRFRAISFSFAPSNYRPFSSPPPCPSLFHCYLSIVALAPLLFLFHCRLPARCLADGNNVAITRPDQWRLFPITSSRGKAMDTRFPN